MEYTAEYISKELAEIQSRIPKNLMANVVREVKSTPTMIKVVDLALADPDFPPEKKKKLLMLKSMGYFERMKYKENPNIAKQIDNFVGREINKKVKAGRLPHPSKLKNLPEIREIFKKVLGKDI